MPSNPYRAIVGGILLLLAAGLPGSVLALPARVAGLDKAELSHAQYADLLREIERTGDQALLAKAYMLRCHRLIGSDPAEARRIADTGIPVSRAAKADEALGGLLACRGHLEDSDGRRVQALKDSEAAIVASLRAGDPAGIARGRMLRGGIRHAQGDYSQALEDLQAAYRGYLELKNENRQRYALDAIADLYADARVAKFDQALDYYRQVLASYEAAGDAAGAANTRFDIAITLVRSGELAAAEAEFQRTLAAQLALGDGDSVAETQRETASLYLRMNRAAEALPLADGAVAQAEASGDPDALARARVTRGAALRQLGRIEEAVADLDIAYRYFKDHDVPRFLETLAGERAQAHAANLDWETAYRARTEQLELDRRLSVQLDEDLSARLRVQFDSERREQEAAALEREARLRDAGLLDAERIRLLQTIVIAMGVMLLAAIALRAHHAASNARKMRDLAMTDELTLLPNRRAILKQLQERLEAPGREPVAVLMLDIDHFKSINDRLGHDVGDRVLRTVADTVRHALGRDGELGRIGGEEFLVVLAPGRAGERAAIAERLRHAVDDRARAAAGTDHHVSISLGGCVAPDNERRVEDVLKRADVALYRAKEGGRNRAVMEH